MHRETVFIAWIYISDAMAEKLASKHRTSAAEVRETFQLPGRPQRGVWHEHPEYGRRLYVEGLTVKGRRLLAILQPTHRDVDFWRLRSAWSLEK